jgi:hypothetical protein
VAGSWQEAVKEVVEGTIKGQISKNREVVFKMKLNNTWVKVVQ